MINAIASIDNLELAYRKSLKGDTKYSVGAMVFSQNEIYNLYQLRKELLDGTYRMGEYFEFYVYEPKKRLVHAPQYRDKVVQLAINNILRDLYNKKFIYDSYGSIKDKGTHECVYRINHFARKAQWEYGEDAFIVKADVEKFFYSIDRVILKNILKLDIPCKRTLNLLLHIVDSADMISHLGLPLGNTFSQLAANIYMNVVDQYIKYSLGVKYYVRYMDDMIVYAKNKAEAKMILNEIRHTLRKELNLILHEEKSDIFPLNQGVNAIGFKIHTTHRLLRDQSKRNIKRKTKKFELGLKEGRITEYKVNEILASWQGHAEHGNSYLFIQSLAERRSYLRISDDGKLMVI